MQLDVDSLNILCGLLEQAFIVGVRVATVLVTALLHILIDLFNNHCVPLTCFTSLEICSTAANKFYIQSLAKG